MAGITEKTLISKELADFIEKEVYALLGQGVSAQEAIKIGTKKAFEFWKAKRKQDKLVCP